jgi:hypothetical protein
VDRLTQGEKLLGVSALWLYIISFIGFWAELEFEGGGTRSEFSVSAWDGYGLEIRLALILALVAAGLVAARAVGVDLPVAGGLVYLVIGGLTLLLMLLTALVGPDESGSGLGLLSRLPSGSHIEVSRAVGLFVGTVFAAAMVAGGYQHLKAGDTTTRSPATPSSSPPTTPTGA